MSCAGTAPAEGSPPLGGRSANSESSKPARQRRAAASTRRNRWHAPARHGEVLIDPPWESISAMLAAAQQARRGWDYDIQGRSLAALVAQAREQSLAAAVRYTSAYRDVQPPIPNGPIFLAGHQPHLFHPGVWFKNVALARLAAQQRGTALNLVIDGDIVRQAALRVPGGSVDAPISRLVPYDAHGPEISFEDRPIHDLALFDSFGRRAADEILPHVPNPLLAQFWPLAQERSRATGHLGESLAQSRHQLEGQWGMDSLELPQGQVCEQPGFCWFAAHLLAHLPRFWEVHNQSLADYRLIHHVRHASRPVPDLASDGDYLEAPFWIWTRSQPRRRGLYVRHRGDGLVLTDRQGLEIDLAISPEGDAAGAAEHLASLAERGIRLRSRALCTTLFARLVLGDLFIHGIGGAKYDEVTDLMIRRFFGFEPPGYVVVSATLLLPGARPPTAREALKSLQTQLRNTIFHPEWYAPCGNDTHSPAQRADDGHVAQLIEQKTRWIRTEIAGGNGRRRCREIRAANQALARYVAPLREKLASDRRNLLTQLKSEAILNWREYGFCLHPEPTLREFMLAFLAARP